MKIITVIGARPQFIKASVVSRHIELNTDLTEDILHTGQHYDSEMSDIFFDELGIGVPRYRLTCGGLGHGEMTGSMMTAIEKILLDEKYDALLVYGDTNSTIAGALTASKLHIPVFHVEAGLRSFNKKMPEEINRILTDHISDLLFTPSALANNNLIREGIEEDKIFEVGDIMLDAIQFAQAKISIKSNVHNSERKGHVLVSIHRQENTDDIHRLENICKTLEYLARDRDSFSHSSANNEKT